MTHRILAGGLLFVLWASLAAQELTVVHIKITVADPDGRVRPVPRHALLISDNPVTAAPRRAVTSLDGTVDVRLRPGNYTVESEEPLIYQGRSYEWMQILDVPAGRDSALELTPANAEAVETTRPVTMPPGHVSPSELLIAWQEHIVTLWSDTVRGAGVVLDRRGLILTTARVVGASEAVEVQFTATRKVAGRVLSVDHAKNVAVVRVAPSLVSTLQPAKLGYRDAVPTLAVGQDVFAIEASMAGQKTLASGTLIGAGAAAIESDMRLGDGAAGTPILTAGGAIAGLTSSDDRGRADAVRIDEAAALLAEAEKKMTAATEPKGDLLPVEPQPSKDASKPTTPKRVVSFGPYQLSTSDFDVTLITPVLNYALQHPPDRTTGATTPGGRQDMKDLDPSRRILEDFGNWARYVSAIPPVLIVRATPKFKESFWTTVGRMAASTQGVSLPPFKKMKDSFARMRLFCDQAEVTPIHPFRIERRFDNDTGVYEGLYVFDPASIGPQCREVKLALFSEKSPTSADERVVDPKIVEQLARDLAEVR